MRLNWKGTILAVLLAVTFFALGYTWKHGEPICRTAHYVESVPNTPSALKPGYAYKLQGDEVAAYTCK